MAAPTGSCACITHGWGLGFVPALPLGTPLAQRHRPRLPHAHLAGRARVGFGGSRPRNRVWGRRVTLGGDTGGRCQGAGERKLEEGRGVPSQQPRLLGPLGAGWGVIRELPAQGQRTGSQTATRLSAVPGPGSPPPPQTGSPGQTRGWGVLGTPVSTRPGQGPGLPRENVTG